MTRLRLILNAIVAAIVAAILVALLVGRACVSIDERCSRHVSENEAVTAIQQNIPFGGRR